MERNGFGDEMSDCYMSLYCCFEALNLSIATGARRNASCSL